MGFKKQNGTPPTQEEMEAYCETCEDGTGVFCPGWIKSMLCSMADDEIKDALFALLHYSQGDMAYRPGTSAAKILADSMRPVMRSNLEKRAKRSADSKKANEVRWQKEGNQKERIGKKEKGKQKRGEMAQINTLIDSALQSDRNPTASLNVNVNVNENVPTPSKSPDGGGLSAGSGGVGFFKVLDLFGAWKNYGDKAACEGRFFAWHATDPQAAAICGGVLANGDTGNQVRTALDKDTAHRNSLLPWPAWRECWAMCETLEGMERGSLEAFAREYEQHTQEPGIFRTLADKAKFMKANKVKNLAAFLASRKQ